MGIRAYEEMRVMDDGEGLAKAVTIKKVYQFLHKTVTALQGVAPDTALQLWLAAAGSADTADRLCGSPGSFEPICNEFLTQGLMCFEEELNETFKQYQAIHTMVGTVVSISCLDAENFDMISQ